MAKELRVVREHLPPEKRDDVRAVIFAQYMKGPERLVVLCGGPQK